jgi:hypothetical protein
MPKRMGAETAIRLFGAPEFVSVAHVERYGFCFAARSLTRLGRKRRSKPELHGSFF